MNKKELEENIEDINSNTDPDVDPNADPDVDPNADPDVDPDADSDADPGADMNFTIYSSLAEIAGDVIIEKKFFGTYYEVRTEWGVPTILVYPQPWGAAVVVQGVEVRTKNVKTLLEMFRIISKHLGERAALKFIFYVVDSWEEYSFVPGVKKFFANLFQDFPFWKRFVNEERKKVAYTRYSKEYLE